jgi:hypothetical protein
MSADPQSRPPGADPEPEPATGADDLDEAEAAATQPADDPAGRKPFTAPEGYELL